MKFTYGDDRNKVERFVEKVESGHNGRWKRNPVAPVDLEHTKADGADCK